MLVPGYSPTKEFILSIICKYIGKYSLNTQKYLNINITISNSRRYQEQYHDITITLLCSSNHDNKYTVHVLNFVV